MHRILVEMRTPAAREALVQLCLAKPGPMAAEAEVVGQVHDPRLVEAFLPLLKQDARAFRNASDVLAPYRDRRATAAVLARVRKDGPSEEPLGMLAESGDQEAFDLLVSLSQKKETENAMLFLAQTPFPEGIRRFFALARSPNQPGARWHTYTIIGIYYMTEPSALVGLKELAATDDKEMRWAAVRAIGTLPGPDADAYAMERVVNGGPEERAALLTRLPQARRGRAGELVLEALKRDPLFRTTAAELAARLPPDPKVDQVVRLLAWDPDTARNWAVNEWLGRVPAATLPRRELLDRAATFAGSADAGVRAKLAGLAREAGHARLWPVLLALVRDGEPTVRCAAWDALRALPDPRALRPALAALNDVEPNVRGRAARVLGQFGTAEAVEPLLAALRDKEKVVVANAAFALAELRDERVASQLVSALREGRVSCSQAQVCQALGRRAEMDGLRYLAGLLQDGSLEQKVWAYQGLNENGWPPGLAAEEKNKVLAAMRDFHRSAPRGVKLSKPPQFTAPQTPPTRPPVTAEDVEF